MACNIDVERVELVEELELLQAIYIHELAIQGPVERPTSLNLLLHPSTGDDDDSIKYVCLSLCLSIPNEYPFTIPGITIQNPRGLSDAHVTSIQDNLTELAKEKTGSPMLYDLIEYTKECLTDNNIPSCPCVICLEHFHETSSFVKTKCYHYFHSICLAKYVDHFIQEDNKVFCPMCRLEVDVDKTAQEAALESCVTEETFIYKPDKKQREAQEERQRILEYQKRKGGIIDVEEERNKYFIGIKDVKREPRSEITAQATTFNEGTATRKDATHGKVGHDSRDTSRGYLEEREGINEDKSGSGHWVCENKVKSRTNRKPRDDPNENGVRTEKSERRTGGRKIESKNRDIDDQGIFRNDPVEIRATGCKRIPKGIPRGRGGDNKGYVHPVTRNERTKNKESNSSQRVNSANTSVGGKKGYGTDRGKTDNDDIRSEKTSLLLKKGGSSDEPSSNLRDTTHQSVKRGGAQSDQNAPKNFRKRKPRKPCKDAQDGKNSSKVSGHKSESILAIETNVEGRLPENVGMAVKNAQEKKTIQSGLMEYPGKTAPALSAGGNRPESSLCTNEQKSRQMANGSGVIASKSRLCRPPPGFETVSRNSKAL